MAINKAAAPTKAAEQSTAPKGKGNLSKSIRIRVKKYRNKGVWVAIVGPGSSFRRSKGEIKRGSRLARG